ncbi:MAG: site-specific integrase [Actinobacteria bacterium]|nr:site-specific integrase [Actinomycetota bacterium]
MTISEMRDHDAPLCELIETFFRANYDLAPSTERWYRQNLRDYLSFVERAQDRGATLRDVNKPMVDAFLKERRTVPTRKYPNGSQFAVRAAAVTLKRFGNYLAEDGILAEPTGLSVLKHVKRGKVDDDVRRPLSDDEQERIIGAATGIGLVARAAAVLGFASGLRLNELREAKVGDFDPSRGEFTVRPETSKFGRSRTVYLHPDVVRELDRYLRNRTMTRDADAPLFPTRTGSAYTLDGFSKLFRRIQSASGMPVFSAHLMRHTWATNFMRLPGASLLELKREGGWQRWEQVERYSHATPHQNRSTLPNPLQKTAFGQQPSTRVSRLSVVA